MMSSWRSSTISACHLGNRRARPQIILAVLSSFWLIFSTRAQEDPNEIPQIRPLHALLPPTFWEQHRTFMMILGLVLVILLALMVWLVSRPKPVIIMPPAVQAREALMALPAGLEEGAKLSKISQILREYLRRAFPLPASERTTTDFCRLLSTNSQIGPELAAALTEFFRDNDRRKFSAEGAAGASVNAVTAALSLIEKSEARRVPPVSPPK